MGSCLSKNLSLIRKGTNLTKQLQNVKKLSTLDGLKKQMTDSIKKKIKSKINSKRKRKRKTNKKKTQQVEDGEPVPSNQSDSENVNNYETGDQEEQRGNSEFWPIFEGGEEDGEEEGEEENEEESEEEGDESDGGDDDEE